MKFSHLTILLSTIILSVASLTAQESPTCYRVTLTDKNNSPYSINNPSEFLSERAITKKNRYAIAITEQDIPVNPQYLQRICAVDNRISVLCVSKWMNTATIYCPDSTKLTDIQNLPFVSNILPVATYDLSNVNKPAVPKPDESPIVTVRDHDSIIPYDYGYGHMQISLHQGDFLHNDGFRGDSMLIVMFDAGWEGVDTCSSFSSLFKNGQIIGTRDLIPWSNNVYSNHYHGTICLSTMSALQESLLVGTAPKANYFLIRSEEPNSEQLIEEDFWAYAAEIADSLGADVISSSLGYNLLADFPQGNPTYADMDGITSIASRAATLLGQKGAVVCVSAGNDGNNEWHYIGHPADAIDILTVGAADVTGNIAPFSSFGPSYDGRVKPDVTSVGVNTVCFWPNDEIGTANGTSLACPVLAGLCACLWQALPEATSTQIMRIVRESSSCYNNPNDSLGYGIPNFYAAYTHNVSVPSHATAIKVSTFPNPTTDVLNIVNPDMQIKCLELYTPTGKLLHRTECTSDAILKINVQNLPDGLYIGRAHLHNGHTSEFKMVKQ